MLADIGSFGSPVQNSRLTGRHTSRFSHSAVHSGSHLDDELGVVTDGLVARNERADVEHHHLHLSSLSFSLSLFIFSPQRAEINATFFLSRSNRIKFAFESESELMDRLHNFEIWS